MIVWKTSNIKLRIVPNAKVAKPKERLLGKCVKALFDVGKQRLGFVLLTEHVLADLFVVSVQARRRLLVALRSVRHLLWHFRPCEARQSSVVLPSVIFCFTLPRQAVGRQRCFVFYSYSLILSPIVALLNQHLKNIHNYSLALPGTQMYTTVKKERSEYFYSVRTH